MSNESVIRLLAFLITQRRTTYKLGSRCFLKHQDEVATRIRELNLPQELLEMF